MEDIKLFSDDYIVKYRAEEVQLLRKEFQLFECLFRNPSRVFTRAELLELVWAQEDPTDRTIDDHIYRVRKKLNPIFPLISIETLRGIGYRLKIRKQEDVSPLKQDDEVSSSMNMLFHKYQLYGQGDALKLLEENQSVFGFELNLQSRLYINFMNGNFRWMLKVLKFHFGIDAFTYFTYTHTLSKIRRNAWIILKEHCCPIKFQKNIDLKWNG
jgi:DNA-binding winged helix-turn-helix (wHTH) protein